MSDYLRKIQGADGAKGFVASDDIVTGGVLTTAGSRMLENFVPPFTASVVEKLTKAGYELRGKSKVSEFALTSISDDIGAHAAGMALKEIGANTDADAKTNAEFALASDAWGQLRVSAVKAGLIGFKPSYGYVSRHGLISNAASLETIGVISRDTAALNAALNVIVFQDNADATSLDAGINFGMNSGTNAAGHGADSADAVKPKIGVAAGFESEGVEKAAKELAALGYEIVRLDAPDVSLAKEICDVIACVEFASMAARYDGVKFGYRAQSDDLNEMYEKTRAEGFGDEAKRRILLGTTYTREKYYEDYAVKAMRLRRVLKESVSALFGACGAWLLPALGGNDINVINDIDDIDDIYQYTRIASLCGFPAIVAPFGENANAAANVNAGANSGVQLIGPHGSDALLIGVLTALEGGIA